MPVMIAPVGEEKTITKIIADDKTKRHLENLGILAGGTLIVLSVSNGDVILKIKDGRVAINKQLAMKIFVA